MPKPAQKGYWESIGTLKLSSAFKMMYLLLHKFGGNLDSLKKGFITLTTEYGNCMFF